MSKLTIASAVLGLLAPLYAQNSPSGPGDFMAERIITLSYVDAPTQPNLPASVIAGIQNGVIELHQRFTYNAAQRTLEQLAFIVPANSPVPFPDPSGAPVGDHYIIQVDSASVVNASHPSLILTGHVTSNDMITPFGDITGTGVTLSIGYTTAGSSVQFGPILESVSPLYGLYSVSGAGSLSLVPSPQKCSQNTLNGVYSFQLSGSTQIQSSPLAFGPYVDNGLFTADGQGNLTVHDSGNSAGHVFLNRTFPIVYVINNDCTGTFAWPGAGMDVQVSKDGSTINMVFTAPFAVVASGSGKRQ
jgi:hypothetical protein